MYLFSPVTGSFCAQPASKLKIKIALKKLLDFISFLRYIKFYNIKRCIYATVLLIHL